MDAAQDLARLAGEMAQIIRDQLALPVRRPPWWRRAERRQYDADAARLRARHEQVRRLLDETGDTLSAALDRQLARQRDYILDGLEL